MNINEQLRESIEQNDKTNVSQILRNGADPNWKDENGITPIHLACIFNSENVFDLLIDAGATVDVFDNEKRTPLHFAAQKSNKKIVQKSTPSIARRVTNLTNRNVRIPLKKTSSKTNSTENKIICRFLSSYPSNYYSTD